MTDWPEVFPAIALSIRQPWPYRILHEGKDVENRSWRTRFRGWFLIHAAKGVDAGDREAVESFGGTGAMPRGGIVGMARVADCVTASDSPWFFGPYGFVLADAVPLAFVPCRGLQGFFRPDIDVGQLRLAA